MSGLIPLTMACLLSAANLQEVPPHVLVAILATEGGKVGETSRPNTNGSLDIGPMQINNKVWVPEVANLHFNGDRNAAYRRLKDDGCYNMHVGAWILRQAIDQSGGDLYEGIGRYHSATPKHKTKYQRMVLKKMKALFMKGGSNG